MIYFERLLATPNTAIPPSAAAVIVGAAMAATVAPAATAASVPNPAVLSPTAKRPPKNIDNNIYIFYHK